MPGLFDEKMRLSEFSPGTVSPGTVSYPQVWEEKTPREISESSWAFPASSFSGIFESSEFWVGWASAEVSSAAVVSADC